MQKKQWMVLVTAGWMAMLFTASLLYADGGEEMLAPRALPKYANAVRSVETDDTVWLTRDGLEGVKKFYESAAGEGERMESAPSDSGGQGYQMRFYKKIGGEEKSLTLLRLEEKIEDRNLHPALGELKAQALMGKHSEAEYQALEKKYQKLSRAYFREVSDDQGGTVSEGEKIYRKAYNQAHGKDKAAVQEGMSDASGKAEAQDMRKKMQEMKARGDMAGMMALAQGASKSPSQTAPGAAAMAAAARDTWELWVTCLEDLDRAACYTRIQHAAPPK